MSDDCPEDWVTPNTHEKSVRSISHYTSRDCRLPINTKCAGMGCDLPDIRLTVCIGECLANCNDINEFGQGFLRMFGSCRRCWGEVGVTATRQPL